MIAKELDAALIPADDFFAAEITDAGWNARTPAGRARDALDWRRLRTEALEPLLAVRSAEWHPFDFAAGTRPDGSYGISANVERREPRPVIVLDGAYSTRPELADLIDLSVLVTAPPTVRHARLSAREASDFLARWHARWDTAEEWYFTHVRPRAAFDFVISNVC
jgi:uridine kinase